MGWREDYNLPAEDPEDKLREALALLGEAVGNYQLRKDEPEPEFTDCDYVSVGVEEFIDFYHNEYHEYSPSRLVVAVANIVSLGRFRDWLDNLIYHFENACRQHLVKDAIHVKSKNYAIVREAEQIRTEYSRLLTEDAKKDAVIAGNNEVVAVKDSLISSLKARIDELEDECRELRSSNKELNAKANYTAQAVEDARASEEGRRAVEVKNGNRFASLDGISAKAKKKMIFVGVNVFGWTFEDIANRFPTKDGPMKESTIIAYYKEAKKKFVRIDTESSSSATRFVFEGDLGNVPFLNYFDTMEQRYIDDLMYHIGVSPFSDYCSPIVGYFKPATDNFNVTKDNLKAFKDVADYPGIGTDFRPMLDELRESEVVEDAS